MLGTRFSTRSSRRLRALAATSVGILVAVGFTAVPSQAAPAAATFVVNSVGDAGDKQANGVCATAAGDCTLRAAIQEANRVNGAARVEFAIPGTGPFLIQTTSRLPEMSNPAGTTVDGYTQAGAVPNTAEYGSNAKLMIQVKGNGAGNGNGFYITGPNNTLRGLSIYDFKMAIWLDGPGATYNSIIGNYVCTDAAGTWNAGGVNGAAGGILLGTGPSYNAIGVPASYVGGTGPSLADRNVISGCAHRGVLISNRTTDYNQVRNNLLGLTPDGSAANPNYSHGIDINYNGDSNFIGGYLRREGNVVSGNIQEGIEVSHGPFNRRAKIIGNFVGTDITGTQLLSYTGNGMMGLRLEGEKTCDPCDPNAGYAEVAYNVVVGNVGGGIQVDKGQQNNNVHDNWFGAFPDGTPAGNGAYGIRVEHGAVDNVFARNVVANNGRGVQIIPTASQPPSQYSLPVLRNTFTQNSIYNNGALGIDLEPIGLVNNNGTTNADTQQGIQAPTIRGISADGTAVTVSTCARCTIELFDTGKVPGRYTGQDSFGQGKTYLASAIAGSDGTAVVDLSASPLPGGKVVSATATDTNKNTSEFSRIVQFVGATAPVITSSPDVRYANRAAFPVAGTGSPFDVVALDATNGTTHVTGTATINEDGTWATQLDLSGLPDGSLTLTAKSTNPAGSVSTDTVQTLNKRTVPLAPAVASAGPVTASNVNAVPVSGTGDPNVTVQLLLSDGSHTATATTTAGPTGAWSTTLAAGALNDGTLTLTATATDVSGTSPASTRPVTKKMVATVPAFTRAGPADVSNRTAVPITGTGGIDDTVTVVVSDGTHTASGFATVGATGTWATTVNVSGLNDGTLTVSATATNAAGSTAGPATTTMAKATAAARPAYTTVGPATGANITAVPVTGTGHAGDTVTVTVTDGVASRAGSAVVQADGKWSLTLDLSTLADGTLPVTAVATNGVDAPSDPVTATLTKATRAVAPVVRAGAYTPTSVAVTWDAPTDTRGLPVTGYRVTVTPGTTVDLPSTARSYASTGRTPDTAYTVSVRALTSAGPGAEGTVSMRTKVKTAITSTYTGPTTVTAGSTITISARLTNAVTGAGIAAPIRFDLYTEAGVKVGKVKGKKLTDANGNWTGSFVVNQTGKYRAVYNGSTINGGSNSLFTPVIRVN